MPTKKLTEEEQRIAREKLAGTYTPPQSPNALTPAETAVAASKAAGDAAGFTDSDVEGVAPPAAAAMPQRENAPAPLPRIDVNNVFSAKATEQNPTSTATEDIIPIPQPRRWTYADMLQQAKQNFAEQRDRNYDTAMMQARGRVLQNIFKPAAWGASALVNGNGPVTIATSTVDDNGTKQGYIDAFKRAQSFSDRLAEVDREGRAYGLNKENYERQIQARKELEESRLNTQKELQRMKNAFEAAKLKASSEEKKALMDYQAEIDKSIIEAKSVAELKKIAAKAAADASVKRIPSVQQYGLNLDSYITAMQRAGMSEEQIIAGVQTAIEGGKKGGTKKQTTTATPAPAAGETDWSVYEVK